MGKPEGKPSFSHPAPAPEQKKQAPVDDRCCASGCKAKGSRYSFCEEHFHQFKFGLIRKDGSPASNYQDKLKHYEAWVARQKLQKVA